MDKETKSQIARMDMEDGLKRSLTDFFNCFIDKVSEDETLETLIKNNYIEKMQSKDGLSDAVQLEVFKTLKNNKSQNINAIMNVIKEMVKAPNTAVNIHNQTDSEFFEEKTVFTKEETKTAKDLLEKLQNNELDSILEDVEKTEF